MKTKDRILNKALELMNQKGLEKISTYDIARALNIRQSNITYYFPTKSDIINALGKQMIEDVDKVFSMRLNDQLTLESFYWVFDEIMQVHQQYNFIFMNYATLITADQELNAHFIKVLKRRPDEFKSVVQTLEANGYLKSGQMVQHSDQITLMLNILAIYWVQEAAIYSADKTDEEKRRHHLAIFFQPFIPYLTRKGEEALMPLLAGQEIT